ncbi:unnamed protein product [Linum trigynum]|uniref:Endonuclease/exonuclease/phosphatase domain-containing protein n=1 Tax=Linum trigynum TaxID=586398 RepID=A0AAV2FD39_9ROSI
MVDSDSQYLHFDCFDLQEKTVVLRTAVYAKPNIHYCLPLWEAIRRLHSAIVHPWLLLGDFNSISGPSERQGGAGFNSYKVKDFNSCIKDCNLIDLGFAGPRFTWTNGHLSQRLDRALCNHEWLFQFPYSSNIHLPRLRSDHRPILVRNKILHPTMNPHRPFCFLAPWLTHDDFQPTLTASWKKDSEFIPSLLDLQHILCKWNKQVFGNILQRKKVMTTLLKVLEMQNNQGGSSLLIEEENKVREELEKTLWQEEVLWMQKACANWIKSGIATHTSSMWLPWRDVERVSLLDSKMKRAGGSRIRKSLNEWQETSTANFSLRM